MTFSEKQKEDTLKRHVYANHGDGPSVTPTVPYWYTGIAGRKMNQEISIYDSGTRQRPDWLYEIRESGKEIYCHRHFCSPLNAFSAALEWIDSDQPQRLRLRPFKWCGNADAITVDGLPSNISVTIAQVGPGGWRFQVSEDGMGWKQWRGPYGNPQDALAAIEAMLASGSRQTAPMLSLPG